MQSDILFNNIYIGHSVEDAEKLAAETFKLKHPVEKALADADKPKEEEKPKSPSDLQFLDDPVHYIKEKVDLFITIAQNDPIEAIKFVPEVAGGIGAIIVTFAALIIGLVGLGGSAPAVKDTAAAAKGKAKETKDKIAQATATGAEKAKGEANKRATRSQS
jgi:calnexin